MTCRLIVIEESQAVRNLLDKALLQFGFEIKLFEDLEHFFAETESLLPAICSDFLVVDGSALGTDPGERIENLAQLQRRAAHVALIADGPDDADFAELRNFNCIVLPKPSLLKPLFSWLEKSQSQIPPDRKLPPWPTRYDPSDLENG